MWTTSNGLNVKLRRKLKTDKNRVAAILAGYSPPLAPSQIDAIAEEISRLSELEKAEAIAKVSKALIARKKKSRKS